jgi:PRTRC genetic system protein A
MKFVGYLQNGKTGLTRDVGLFYNYILAGNGLFIRSASKHLEQTICIAPASIRGLEPLEEKIILAHGPIPRYFYELAFSTILTSPGQEKFIAITWNNGYHIKFPQQKGTAGSVEYEKIPDTVLDIHSHGAMPAFFSSEDDRDEQGFKLSLVMGKIADSPEYMMRATAYGYFRKLEFDEVFTDV